MPDTNPAPQPGSPDPHAQEKKSRDAIIDTLGQYRYHGNAILFCDSHKLLDGVAYSIDLTVPRKHPDYARLVAAIQHHRAILGDRTPGDKAADGTLFPPRGIKPIA